MTLRKLRGGDVLAGLAGLALLGLLFAPWFREGAPAHGVSAWHSLTIVLALLILVALLGLAVFALTAFERSPAVPTAAAAWSIVLGIVVAVVVLVRLLAPPGATTTAWGGWTGLACVLAIVGGAVWSLRQDVRPYHRSG